ncbi:MAG: serine/threonine protein kinase, partial [Verrucomicrobia bacterium]|nr:serine/threonine protein kinase [Verrucomicrobiota bacterium]
GGIEVKGLPAGATVKLANGKSLSGPGRIMDLTPAMYDVVVEKPEHDPQTLSIEVKEGKFTLLPPVELKAHVGRVVLASDPPGAKFFIGGKQVTADANGALVAELRPGPHEITAEHGQWPSVRRQVQVTKDGELNEVFEFYPGRVEITSDPAGAKVVQNGKERGETPLILTNEPPGGVLFTLIKDDFNQETVRGEVRGKEVLRLDRKLTKEQGTLLLTSAMPGVNVYIDGRPLGQLGASMKLETNVSPGRHEITAILLGWPQQERTVEVSRGKVSAVQFEFAPASVVVSSEPPGATIVLRGTAMNRTPFTLNEVKPGALNLLLQMEGYDPVSIDTNVLSGETLALHAVLPRMSRPFRIKTTPPDALLAMDGIPLTNRPPSFTVGKHTLRIEKDGYEAREVEVDIKAEGLNNLGEFVLERTAGEIQVVATPASATFEVFVNGATKRAKSTERLGIPTGKHKVLVKAEGYDPRIVDVEVTKNQITSQEVALVRSMSTMRVLTTPEGAGYSLSGPDQVRRSGKTPNDELQLPTGTYQVTFTMAGFETTNRTVEVHNTGAVIAEVSLIRSQAPLRIQVNQTGATYKLSGPDGFYRDGDLPLPPTSLPTGSYKLEVEKEGFDAVKQEFELKKGDNRLVNVELLRSKGTLLATIAPIEATTELRGSGFNKAVTSGTPLVGIPTGDYELVSRYKKWSVTNRVSIQRQQTNVTAVALPFGTVRIESVPAKAVVMRGSEVLGETPLDLTEQPVGTANYQLRLARHRFVDVAATVQEQKTVRVTRTLEAYPGPQPGMTEWVNSLGMRFVPVGNVWVCVWETRVKDFQAFYDATRHNAGAEWRDPGFKQTASEPVVEVSWNDAMAFCKWLTGKETQGKVLDQASYRLPTEAEWLQTLKTAYPAGNYLWGNAWPLPSGMGNLADNITYDRHRFTAPAGSYFPARNGVYDLIGNVWEWCQDGSGGQRTLLGESWMQYPGSDFTPSMQRSLGPDIKGQDIGFRIVLAPAP